MKKVLIIGKDSYLGENFKKWLEKFPDEYSVEMAESKDGLWKRKEFSEFECVVNFAGIAHINNITAEMENLFYSVNRDLAIEIGEWAKAHGVKHFVQFSSMNVYGDRCDNIEDRKKTNPTNFYGDSKLQGDIGLHRLASSSFIVASIRPPFVYGAGCTGNYNLISKIAKKTPVFPTYKNKKSMIYIDNLCEFVRWILDEHKGGIFTPQNEELVSTADLVREIAKQNGHTVWFTSLFNCFIPLVCKLFRVAQKAFANDNYDLKLSGYNDFKYDIVSFEESIQRTERNTDG